MIETTLSGSSLPILQSQLLNEVTGIVHFSTEREYNMCDYVGDDPIRVTDCRKQFAAALDLPVERLWFPRQVHGTTIIEVDSETPHALEADAVITTEPGLCIGVSTADCVPVLLVMMGKTGEDGLDDGKEAPIGIAAIHAGWRGTVKHIVSKAVARLIEVTGGDASHIVAAIGPSISPDAYEVGEEVAAEFVQAGRSDCVVRYGYPKPHIDLWQSNVMDLMEAGVDLGNIDCTPVCTWSNEDRLFSARRLGIRSGRISTCILMKK